MRFLTFVFYNSNPSGPLGPFYILYISVFEYGFEIAEIFACAINSAESSSAVLLVPQSTEL